MTVRKAVLVAVIALYLSSTACSSGKSTDQDGATSPGVSDKTIKLGIDTVLTGPFAAQGKGLVQGLELYWDKQNANGGVCDRTVELVSRDQGYDVQKAVAAYTEIKDQVLGFALLSGSPATMALLPSLKRDKMLTLTSAYTEAVLSSDEIVLPGTPYGLEMVNGVDYLISEGRLKEGDVIGYVWQQGAYGEAGLAGARFAAKKHGLTVVDQQISAAEENLKPAVSAIRAKKASVIMISASAGQTATTASVAEAQNYDVPIMSSNPGFAPALLDTTARKALEDNLLLLTSVAPFSGPGESLANMRKEFAAKYPKQPPNLFVVFGYGAGQVYSEILKKACDGQELTRKSLLKVRGELSKIDTDGAFVELDLSGKNEPASSQIYVLKPDIDSEGRLKIVSPPFEGETAKSYKP